jgi:hypothetical protein
MKTQINSRLLLTAIFFGVSFFSAKTATAQDNRNVAIGFKVSPNFTWTRIMEGAMENNGMGLGFSYGLMADINIAKNPNYWFSTEFIVTSAPTKINSTDTVLWSKPISTGGIPYNDVNFSYNLQYIQIPLTLKLKTNEIGNFKYWGQFGVAPSFLIQQKIKTVADPGIYSGGSKSHNPNSGSNDNYDFKGDVNQNGSFQDDVRVARLPLVLGAGIESKISGRTTFVAGLRFDNAFSDLFVDEKVDGRNNYLGIQLGIFF